MNERLRHRLGLRSSNAAQPHVNRKREAKIRPPWDFPEDFNDVFYDCEDDEPPTAQR